MKKRVNFVMTIIFILLIICTVYVFLRKSNNFIRKPNNTYLNNLQLQSIKKVQYTLFYTDDLKELDFIQCDKEKNEKIIIKSADQTLFRLNINELIENYIEYNNKNELIKYNNEEIILKYKNYIDNSRRKDVFIIFNPKEEKISNVLLK